MKFKILFPLGVIVIFLTIMVVSYSISNLPKDPSEVFSSNTCECLNTISSSNSSKYKDCILDDYDDAHDFWEEKEPNRQFVSQEALIQAYWMENCNE